MVPFGTLLQGNQGYYEVPSEPSFEGNQGYYEVPSEPSFKGTTFPSEPSFLYRTEGAVLAAHSRCLKSCEH